MKKSLHQKNVDRYLRLDTKALAIIDHLIDDDIVRGKTLEVLESLKTWHEEKGFLTEKQRKLTRDIKQDYADLPYLKELMAELVNKYNEGLIDASGDFIPSVTDFFNETHKLTPLQMEQVINIVSKSSGQNPEDDSE